MPDLVLGPQISRAFRVGSPSCTSMREDEKEGSVLSNLMILLRVRGRWVGLLGLAGCREAGRFHRRTTHLEAAGANDGSSRVTCSSFIYCSCVFWRGACMAAVSTG